MHRRVGRRWQAACLLLLATALVCGSCGFLGGPGGPSHAHSIVYEARYADYRIHATGTVAYTAASGRAVSETVTLPWHSRRIPIRSGRSYRVTLAAAPAPGSNSYCGVETNNGWDLGNGPYGGNCGYTFNTSKVP